MSKNRDKRRPKARITRKSLEHIAVFDFGEAYANRRLEKQWRLGKLGPASPVRRIDPKTGQIIGEFTQPQDDPPWMTDAENAAQQGPPPWDD